VSAAMEAVFRELAAELATQGDGPSFISANDMFVIGNAAGLDLSRGDARRRGPTFDAMLGAFAASEDPQQQRALDIIASRLSARRPEQVTRILEVHGYALAQGHVVAALPLQAEETQFIPNVAHADLQNALNRLRGEGESGAISAACGAVDSVTSHLYVKYGLGDPGKASFSSKVNTAAQKLGVFDDMQKEFVAIGIDAKEASEARAHFEAAINGAAQALQIVRKRMGDVHGSRPALRSTAYDSIKFAAAICALFENKV
jgi:hypothetical protein